MCVIQSFFKKTDTIFEMDNLFFKPGVNISQKAVTFGYSFVNLGDFSEKF